MQRFHELVRIMYTLFFSLDASFYFLFNIHVYIVTLLSLLFALLAYFFIFFSFLSAIKWNNYVRCDARHKDKKYEMLKSQYWITQRNLKILTQKYINLKAEKEKLDKKMLTSEMHKDFSQSVSSMKPRKSDIFTPSSSTG